MDEKVLLNVEINAREALENYVKIQKRIDELRDSQKKMKDENQQGSQAYFEMGQQIKALTKRSQEYQKEIQNTIKSENEQQGSLQQLKAQLSLATQEYNKMSEDMRKSKAGLDKQKEIVGLTTALNQAEQGLLNFHRQVGNYGMVAKDLAKEMADLKNQLIGMADAGLKDSQEFKEMTARVEEIKAALNPFADELQSTQQQLKKLTDDMIAMKLAGQDGTEEYKKMADEAAKLKDAIADVTAQINTMAGDTAKLQGLNQSLALLSNTMSILDRTTKELGIGVPELQKGLKMLTGITSLLTVAIQFQTAAQKQSIVYATAEKAVNAIKIKQLAKMRIATLQETIATSASTVAVKAATIATKAWNAVLNANPVVLIATGVGLLISAVGALISILGSEESAEEKAAAASKRYEEQQRRTEAAITEVNNKRDAAVNKLNNSLREQTLELKKRGATEEEIADLTLKKEQEIRDAEIKASKERQKEQERSIKLTEIEIRLQQYYLKQMDEEDDEYEEQKKKVEDLTKALRDLNKEKADEQQKVIDLTLKKQEAEQEAADKKKQQDKKDADKAKQDAKKAAEQQLEFQKQSAELQLKQQRKAAEDELELSNATGAKKFAVKQEWDKKQFDSTQDFEKRKLDQQRKNGDITQKQYENQLALLAAKQNEFAQNQAAEAKKQVLSQFNSVLSEVGKQTKQVIAEVDNSFANSMNAVREQLGIDSNVEREFENLQQMMAMYKQQEEDMMKFGAIAQNASGATMEADRKRFAELEQKMFEYYRIEEELKQQAEDKKTAIEQAAIDKRMSRLFQAIEDEDAMELLDYTKTEEEKNSILIEQSKKRIEILKREAAATGDPKVKLALEKKIAEEENNLRALGLKKLQIAYDKELLAAGTNAKNKYDIKLAYLQKELEAVKGNADAEAEINQQMAEARSEYLEGLSSEIGDWSQKAFDALGSINDVWNNIENGRLADMEAANEKEKAEYQKMLDNKLISQEEYDAKTAKLDEELDKKQKEIARKQAIRQKALNLMQTSIAAAQAIIMSLAQSPISYGPFPNPAGIASLTLATITGAAQIAAVAAEPLPKASRGALLQGPSHAQGGIPIEAEGGEAIINKKATKRYLPLLSAINESTGGVPLYANGGMVQQAMRQSQASVDYSQLAEAMSKVNINSQVAVTDINRGQSNYARVEQLRTF